MKPALIPPVLGFALLGLLAAAGWFHTVVAPDTASYLAVAKAIDPLGASRLPLYGWVAGWMLAHAAPLLAWLQATIFLGGAALLVASLERVGASRAAASAIGIAIGASTMLLLWVRDAVPEAAGHGFLFAGFAAALLAAEGSLLWVLPAALAVTLAWSLVPGLLGFAVLLAALPLLLPTRWYVRRWARALLLLAALAAPAAGLVAWRTVREGSPSVVSYGGFVMSGIGGLMLTPSVAARLPADEQAQAEAILAARTRLEQQGLSIPVPANSRGARSFFSAALFYFDIMARTYDSVVFHAVRPTRPPGESWPHFDQRLQRLTIEIVRAAPADYLAWVAGAAARLVGHALILNPVFILAFLTLLAMLLWRRGGMPAAPPEAARDTPILLAVSFLYVLGTGAPIVLITFPAERYIDSTALLLAAWPILGVLRLLNAKADRAPGTGSS